MKKLKKLLSFAVALIMALSMLTVASIISFAAENEYIPGDVNGDGRITATDARMILRYSAQLENFSDEQLSVADINADGNVNASDARIALRISARLDDISNYIDDEPDITELSDYMLCSVDKVIEETDAHYDRYDGTATWYFDDFALIALWFDNDNDGEFDDENAIDTIVIHGGNKYSLFGVRVGMSEEAAVDILEMQGHSIYVDHNSWLFWKDYNIGYTFSMSVTDGKIDTVRLEFAPFIDFYYLISENLADLQYFYPEFKLVEGTSDTYSNGIVDITVSEYGYVTDVSFFGPAEAVSLYNIYLGMPADEVDVAMADNGFEKVDDYYFCAQNYKYIYVTYDESGNGVKCVDVRRSAYTDLSDYTKRGYDENLILNDFDGLVQHEGCELAEGEKCYYLDSLHFTIRDDGIVREVSISGESDFNIYGVYYGMDIEDAYEILSEQGFELKFNSYVSDYCYLYIESEDEETVSKITFGSIKSGNVVYW